MAEHCCEPPILANTPVNDLEMFVASGDVPVVDFPKYPCHTQSVERGVKLVTEASAAVCGVNARDGFIRARLESRKVMPRFNTSRILHCLINSNSINIRNLSQYFQYRDLKYVQ